MKNVDIRNMATKKPEYYSRAPVHSLVTSPDNSALSEHIASIVRQSVRSLVDF